MTFNHLVLVGGGHSHVLLMKKWIMRPELMPNIPISIISRDSHLVYSSIFPSVVANSVSLEDSLIDISALANSAKISFIQDEVKNIDFTKKLLLFNQRSDIRFSKLIMNVGSKTKVSDEYLDLVKQKIAFTIKPFFSAYQIIKSEDKYNNHLDLPFVIVGSGYAAIEMAFALRKRWEFRTLVLVCVQQKIHNRFLRNLKKYNIKIKSDLEFEYKRVLLCTGNDTHSWLKNNIFKLDSKGRIKTDCGLKVINNNDSFGVGDCASNVSRQTSSSGIHAVKVVNTLANNLRNEFNSKKLKKWRPQKRGMQIINCLNDKLPKAFFSYGDYVFGPSHLFWILKKNIDKKFIQSLKVPEMGKKEKINKHIDNDCRGCAAKISQSVLNSSLRKVHLGHFADSPEDAAVIFKNDKQTILQSIDGFPALLSDPWLNSKITTYHACSDLWACGAKLRSLQASISLPNVNEADQDHLFSQTLGGIKSAIDELGGEIIGGHTFESRSLPNKPLSLGIEISLSVQGILGKRKQPWRKSGVEPGNILLMSKPLGIGIFFAARMRNISSYDSYQDVMKNMTLNQQRLIDEINNLEENLNDKIVYAATDITGFGLVGHLREMIDSTNKLRQSRKQPNIRAKLDLSLLKSYAGINKLIRQGVRSSIFYENKKIFDQINSVNIRERIITIEKNGVILKNIFLDEIDLIIDPQTCGPLLISCNPEYEQYLKRDWYKIGSVF